MSEFPADANLAFEVANSLAARKFPPGSKCYRCEFSIPLALLRRSKRVICYSCDLEIRTGRRTENHHIAGNHIGPVVEIDGNLHRCLSAVQFARRAADAKLPLLARFVRGYVDFRDFRPAMPGHFHVWSVLVPPGTDVENLRGAWKYNRFSLDDFRSAENG
ncbi:MAG: hypothetical protein R3C29_03975 [Dehalococcoidia bacterium]